MISGLITSPSYGDPVFPYGESLETFGLQNRGVVNGFGLVTRGFLWQIYDIWFDKDYYMNLSTTWTNNEPSITTTWTNRQYGIVGEYTP